MDIVLAVSGLLAVAPLLLPVMLLVWLQDRHSPFYIANRVGLHQRPFRMVKLRSMVVDADRTGVDSTAGDDARITPLGRFIRRYKLDELTQLWNVLIGDMSLVGPRPNVAREVILYTPVERRLLDVRPGITDFASIVFADEADILRNQPDPDIAYNQLIRPWKSRLGLFYMDHDSLALDFQLIGLTLLALISRSQALAHLSTLLAKLDADPVLRRVASRREPLQASPPPGAEGIVTRRDHLAEA